MQYKKNLEKILGLGIKRRIKGGKVTDINNHIRLSRSRFYIHWKMYKNDRLDILKDNSKMTHTRHKIDKQIEQSVLKIIIHV